MNFSNSQLGQRIRAGQQPRPNHHLLAFLALGLVLVPWSIFRDLNLYVWRCLGMEHSTVVRCGLRAMQLMLVGLLSRATAFCLKWLFLV